MSLPCRINLDGLGQSHQVESADSDATVVDNDDDSHSTSNGLNISDVNPWADDRTYLSKIYFYCLFLCSICILKTNIAF